MHRALTVPLISTPPVSSQPRTESVTGTIPAPSPETFRILHRLTGTGRVKRLIASIRGGSCKLTVSVNGVSIDYLDQAPVTFNQLVSLENSVDATAVLVEGVAVDLEVSDVSSNAAFLQYQIDYLID
ncbi:MAG: hypothetical protein WBB28_01710 [Crinalium sp.]